MFATLENDYVTWPCVLSFFAFLAVPALALSYFAFRKARARLRDDSYRKRLSDLLEGPPPASVRGAYPWLWIAVTALFALVGFAITACCGIVLLSDH